MCLSLYRFIPVPRVAILSNRFQGFWAAVRDIIQPPTTHHVSISLISLTGACSVTGGLNVMAVKCNLLHAQTVCVLVYGLSVLLERWRCRMTADKTVQSISHLWVYMT